MAEDILTQMNRVNILALRPYKNSDQNPNGRSNSPLGVRMHRVLKDGVLYKLYSEFDINTKGNRITLNINNPQELYDIKQRDRKEPIRVSFSAIVGENGSGKSTIVDYIIRIVNNLSAVLFGERYYSSSAEHLHYINDVNAELFVLIDNNIFRIACKDKTTRIDLFELTKRDENLAEFKKNTQKEKSYVIDPNEPCIGDKTCNDILSKFCYTMIVNYSLYSFDASSYIGELTSDVKERITIEIGNTEGFTNKKFHEIKKQSDTNRGNQEFLETKSWLSGIMRKYDSYQVPLLITPNRQNGQVYQRKEYINGKERLLSLAILRDENGKRSFTQINNKETIDRITLKLNYAFAKQTYYSIFEESFPNLSDTMRLCLYNLVRQTIVKKFNMKKTGGIIETAAWYYIVYTFFDIVRTYPKFEKDWHFFQTITNRLDTKTIAKIKALIEDVCVIHTHATRRFMRSIYYLNFNLIEKIAETNQSNSLDKEYEISIDDFSEKANRLQKRNSEIVHYVDELLPPPIFDLDFKLYSNEDKNKKNAIAFETLSSGEKQITLSLSTIYYYLSNLDSTSHKNTITTQGNEKKETEKDIINYSHVCVIFDELELYFHPEMQRTFISRLLYGLKQLSFEHIESIQFLMVTHSPFILSDVPRKNVLFLDKNGIPCNVEDMRTFGANIHTMLDHSFFLKNGTIGAYAKRIIGEIEACLNIYKICGSRKKDIIELKKDTYNLIKEKYEKEYNDIIGSILVKKNNKYAIEYGSFRDTYPKERIRATIDLFDEPLIKKVLLDDFYEVFPLNKKEDNRNRIKRWEKQLAYLKNVLKNNPDDKATIMDLISELKNNIKSYKKNEK